MVAAHYKTQARSRLACLQIWQSASPRVRGLVSSRSCRFGKPLQPVRECRPLHSQLNGDVRFWLPTIPPTASIPPVGVAVRPWSARPWPRTYPARPASVRWPSRTRLRKQAKPAVEPVAQAPAKPVAAPAKVASKPAAKAAEKPARSGGFSVKAAWAARLSEQSDRCRLPRGKVRQAHV